MRARRCPITVLPIGDARKAEPWPAHAAHVLNEFDDIVPCSIIGEQGHISDDNEHGFGSTQGHVCAPVVRQEAKGEAEVVADLILFTGPNRGDQHHTPFASLEELGGTDLHIEALTQAEVPQVLALFVVRRDNPDVCRCHTESRELHDIPLDEFSLRKVLPRGRLARSRLLAHTVLEDDGMGRAVFVRAIGPVHHVVAGCRTEALQDIGIDSLVVEVQDRRVGTVRLQQGEDPRMVNGDGLDDAVHQRYAEAEADCHRRTNHRPQLLEVPRKEDLAAPSS
mmetsp:Transcript_46595/g.92676  ORF Transcript_46595/g.92676 Transcript_46595/m.92676 type:complete len:280 (-) Transcript_46595:91-930(-)